MKDWVKKLYAVLLYGSGVFLLWLIRPRVLIYLFLIGCVALVSYHYYDTAIALAYLKKGVIYVSKAMSLIEREAILISTNLWAFLAKAIAKVWTKKGIVAFVWLMLTRPVRRWLIELHTIVRAIARYRLVYVPIEWWRSLSTQSRILIIFVIVSVLVTFVGVHILGLLIFISLDILKATWRVVFVPLRYFGPRIAASSLVTWLQFTVLPKLYERLPTRVRMMHPVVKMKQILLSVSWLIMRRLVNVRRTVRNGVQEHIEARYKRIAARRAARRVLATHLTQTEEKAPEMPDPPT